MDRNIKNLLEINWSNRLKFLSNIKIECRKDLSNINSEKSIKSYFKK